MLWTTICHLRISRTKHAQHFSVLIECESNTICSLQVKPVLSGNAFVDQNTFTMLMSQFF